MFLPRNPINTSKHTIIGGNQPRKVKNLLLGCQICRRDKISCNKNGANGTVWKGQRKIALQGNACLNFAMPPNSKRKKRRHPFSAIEQPAFFSEFSHNPRSRIAPPSPSEAAIRSMKGRTLYRVRSLLIRSTAPFHSGMTIVLWRYFSSAFGFVSSTAARPPSPTQETLRLQRLSNKYLN